MKRIMLGREAVRKTIAGVTLAVLVIGLAGPAWPALCLTCQYDNPTIPGVPIPKPPQIAIQFNGCFAQPQLGFDLQPLVDSLMDGVDAAFERLRDMIEDDELTLPSYYLPALWPNPDIRVRCPDANNTNITVWFEQPGFYGSGDTDAARETLANTLALRKVDHFAIQVHDGAIAAFLSLATAIAQAQINKTSKGTFLEGDVHLTGKTVSYGDSSKTIATQITGRVDGQITGEYTPFWIAFNEQLYMSVPSPRSYSKPAYQRVSCNGSASFDYGSSVDTVLGNLFVTLLDPIVVALNNHQDVDIDAMIDGQIMALDGPGCMIAPMFPSQVLVPGTTFKLVFDYTRLVVSGGVTAAGETMLVPRSPSVSILGPYTIWAESDTAPAAKYYVSPRDLRAPLTVHWEAPNGGVVAAPSSLATTISWPGLVVQAGSQYSRKVKLTVTDADGATVSRERWILIKSADTQPEPGCLMNCDPVSQ